MSLIDTYNNFDLDTIEEFISSQQEENLNLDFKEINRDDLSHNDDKKNLAKSLSGFANSDGGIIVWGVKARKNSAGVDCAQEKIIIDNIPRFVSRLNELTGRVVNPIVEGVLHKGLKAVNNSGFAVSYIPASDSGPHMAKLGEDRYYKRSGDSFYRIEHFDIEDMFGRRKRPKLILTSQIKSVQIREKIKIEIMLKLKNIGRGSARAPFLQILKSVNNLEWDSYGFDGNRNFGLDPMTYYSNAPMVVFSSDTSKIIHPSIELDITRINCYLINQNLREQIKDFSLEYTTTAEDITINKSTLIISKNDIYQSLVSNNVNVSA